MDRDSRHLIEHALGFYHTPGGRLNRRWSYRNHFCAPMEYEPEDRAMTKMVEAGWMIPGRVINNLESGFPCEMQYFHVTLKGAREAGLLQRFRHEDRLPARLEPA